MKRVFICLFLALIMIFPMLPCRVQAAENRMLCKPGDTFYAVFALAEDGDRPDGVMARLVFDTDLFAVVPGIDLIGADGFSILNRHPAVLQFKVSRFAPPGEYSIEAAVVEAADADGKKYTNAKIAPVRIVVESAAGAAAESRKQQIEAGDYVTFGHYPQTAAGNDQTPIEWLVLDIKDNKALLLSKFGLDAKPYNAKAIPTTWETCTIRNWLNGEFMEKAFSTEEQRNILITMVDNTASQCYNEYSTDGGNDTKDKVFLLSYSEAKKYLGIDNNSNTKTRIAPTEYALKQAAYVSSDYMTADDAAAGWWWLRSPGHNHRYAACVIYDGSLHYYRVYNVFGCVRPSIWVNTDAISH